MTIISFNLKQSVQSFQFFCSSVFFVLRPAISLTNLYPLSLTHPMNHKSPEEISMLPLLNRAPNLAYPHPDTKSRRILQIHRTRKLFGAYLVVISFVVGGTALYSGSIDNTIKVSPRPYSHLISQKPSISCMPQNHQE